MPKENFVGVRTSQILEDVRHHTHDDLRVESPEWWHKKARAGEIPNFTGIGAPYEAPSKADLVLDGS